MKHILILIIGIISGCSQESRTIKFTCPVTTDMNPEVTSITIEVLRSDTASNQIVDLLGLDPEDCTTDNG